MPAKKNKYFFPDLKPLRESIGLTQVELARRSHISAATIRRIEREQFCSDVIGPKLVNSLNEVLLDKGLETKGIDELLLDPNDPGGN